MSFLLRRNIFSVCVCARPLALKQVQANSGGGGRRAGEKYGEEQSLSMIDCARHPRAALLCLLAAAAVWPSAGPSTSKHNAGARARELTNGWTRIVFVAAVGQLR